MRDDRRWPRLFRTICALGTLAFVMASCGGGHDRPLGHDATTFDISPSGLDLVFNAAGEGGCDLYRFDLQQRLATRLARTPEYESAASFSRGGECIVFAAGQAGDPADHVFIRRLRDGNVRQVTTGRANDASPRFSPDGSLIVFSRDKTYNSGGLATNWDAGGVICVAKSDGSELREITRDDLIAIDPRFSPDGKTILFWSERGIYTVALDGIGGPRRISSGSQPTYSPDGRSIAFSMGRYAPDYTLYTMGADGTDARPVVHVGGGCFRPAYSTDGQRIIFLRESWPDGPTGTPKYSICEVGIDGGGLQTLTDTRFFDAPLLWKP